MFWFLNFWGSVPFFWLSITQFNLYFNCISPKQIISLSNNFTCNVTKLIQTLFNNFQYLVISTRLELFPLKLFHIHEPFPTWVAFFEYFPSNMLKFHSRFSRHRDSLGIREFMRFTLSQLPCQPPLSRIALIVSPRWWCCSFCRHSSITSLIPSSGWWPWNKSVLQLFSFHLTPTKVLLPLLLMSMPQKPTHQFRLISAAAS